MASRILNRRELRREAEGVVPNVTPTAVPPGKKATKAPARPRKPRAKKPTPRMRARWGIFDGGMKQVAIFDYNARDAADAKLRLREIAVSLLPAAR